MPLNDESDVPLPGFVNLEVPLNYYSLGPWYPRTFAYVAFHSGFTLERLAVPYGRLQPLEEWLKLLPSLEKLDVRYGECLGESELFMMENYELVPRLEVLHVRVARRYVPDTVEADTEALVLMIKSRWRSDSSEAESQEASRHSTLTDVYIG